MISRDTARKTMRSKRYPSLFRKRLSVSFVHFNQAYHLCKAGELYARRNLIETHSAVDWKLSIG